MSGWHGIYRVVLTNPPFGKKSGVTIVTEDGKSAREGLTFARDDFWATTSNKQLNFVQPVFTILEQHGLAAVVAPDNVLFKGDAGETIRRRLLAQCDVHTLLRLPTGICGRCPRRFPLGHLGFLSERNLRLARCVAWAMSFKMPLVLSAVLVAGAAFGQVSAADRAFLKEATQGNRGEVLLGRLASQRGGTADIRAFGRRMVADHSKALAEVQRLAYDKRVTVPVRPKAEDRALHRRLSRLRGVAFDRAYKQAMIEDHRMDVAAFARESQRGRDGAVRAWARKTLPTLRMHLQMIQAARV